MVVPSRVRLEVEGDGPALQGVGESTVTGELPP